MRAAPIAYFAYFSYCLLQGLGGLDSTLMSNNQHNTGVVLIKHIVNNHNHNVNSVNESLGEFMVINTNTIQCQSYAPGSRTGSNGQSGQLSTSRRLIIFVQALPETLQKFGMLLQRHYHDATTTPVHHGGTMTNALTAGTQPSHHPVVPDQQTGRLATSGRLITLIKGLPRLIQSLGSVINHQCSTTNRGLAGALLSSALAATIGGTTGFGAGAVLGGAYILRKITTPQALLICASALAPAAISAASVTTTVTSVTTVGSIGSSILVGGACTVGGLLVLRQGIHTVAKAIRPHTARIIRVVASCLLGTAVGITLGGPIGLGVGLGIALLGSLPEVRWAAQKAARALITPLRHGRATPTGIAVA